MLGRPGSPLTEGVFISKGGQGKSFFLMERAFWFGFRGFKVLILDADSVYSISTAFNLGGDLFENIKRQKARGIDLTLKRVIQYPEKGLDGIVFDFGLKSRLLKINDIDRSIIEALTPSKAGSLEQDYLQWIINHYGVNLDNIGEISLIPNDGTFVEAINKAAKGKANHRLLSDSVWQAYNVYLDQGGEPFDVILVDTPGDNSSEMPIQGAYMVDRAFIPFTPDQAGLGRLGIQETLTQVFGTLMADESMYRCWPQIMPPVPNQCIPTIAHITEAYLTSRVKPILTPYNLTVADHRIEYSLVVHSGVPETLTAFEFDPTDPAIYNIMTYFDAVGVQP